VGGGGDKTFEKLMLLEENILCVDYCCHFVEQTEHAGFTY